MENEGARFPCGGGAASRLRQRRSGPERTSELACHFRQSARSRLVQFDTHRTRQIAAENGGIPSLSSGGSFTIKFDLPPNLQSFSSQPLSGFPEKRHSQAAQRYSVSDPDLTDSDAGRQAAIAGPTERILRR